MAHWTYDPKNKTIDAFVRGDGSHEPIALVTDERSVKQMLVTAELGEKAEFVVDRYSLLEAMQDTDARVSNEELLVKFTVLLMELKHAVKECVEQTSGQRRTSEIVCPLTPQSEFRGEEQGD